jgi:hypothetical protein
VSLNITASEIINSGKIFSAIPRNFQNLQPVNHALAVNNRSASFIPGAAPGGYDDRIHIDHGFILADSSVSWLRLYTGRIHRTRSPHAWGSPHNAIIESSSIIAEKLQTKIGAPATDGTRQPFMHGTYLANAELEKTSLSTISNPYGTGRKFGTDKNYGSGITKTGTGTGTLGVLGVDDYSGNEDLNIRVKAETTGEIGAATFKWSSDGGQTWEKTGIMSQNITLPITLTNRIKVYWIAGTGNDLVANDYWDFTISAQVHKYVVPGFPFSSIPSVYNNAVEIFTGFTVTPATGEILLTGSSGRLRARAIKDELTHPVDVIEDILTEVGLSTYINALSFAAAKEVTLPYNIGTRFENVAAAKAIQLITQACLFFFWVDSDQIYLYAYTGSLI